ncbi:MAG: glycosyltransferase [Anaerolineales bacterium]|nr:glycosyltransferase [Anaerolineales bacterium]
MRVLLLSKAFVVGAYQRKLEALAACPGLELTAVTPPSWRDQRGLLTLERAYTSGYRLVVTPVRFNGRFHLHYYPRLAAVLAEARPDLVHVDEEPYNFATWHAQRLARRAGAKTVFFSWQNLRRAYPWPFSAFEREVLRHADAGIAGNQDAVAVWRAKGYTGLLSVIPQVGVDPDLFAPDPAPAARDVFTIGFAGRFVPEKGVDLLLRAAAQLPGEARVRVLGAGPELPRLARLAADLGLAACVSFAQVSSLDMPAQLAALDCLVLPSRTRPNWKEQFGRVLIEAMACGVPVIGSTCGEIPHVIGAAGLIFAEDDAAALAAHLRALQADPARRAALGAAGRARVLAHYTQAQVARATAALYRQVLTAPGLPA